MNNVLGVTAVADALKSGNKKNCFLSSYFTMLCDSKCVCESESDLAKLLHDKEKTDFSLGKENVRGPKESRI